MRQSVSILRDRTLQDVRVGALAITNGRAECSVKREEDKGEGEGEEVGRR